MTVEMMIDIETLDVTPKSVVLSLAAVPFTNEEGAIMDKVYYHNLEIQSQLDKGRLISEDTLLWWLEQDPEILAEATKAKKLPPDKVLKGLAVACKDVEVFWSNGPMFDIIILEDLARDFDVFENLPWKFYQHRCLRTIKEEAGLDRRWKPNEIPSELKGSHDPVTDCYIQIEALREARDILPLARL